MSLVFLLCKNLEQALAAGLIFGIGYGAYISVDWALGADVLPNKEDAGKDMAVWHVSMTLPQQIAPLCAGLILGSFKIGEVVEGTDKVARYGLAGYGVVFGIAAVSFFVGGILVKNVRGVK
jgi:MFS family permease